MANLRYLTIIILIYLSLADSELPAGYEWEKLEEYFIHAIENNDVYKKLLKQWEEDKLPGVKEFKELKKDSFEYVSKATQEKLPYKEDVKDIFVNRMVEITNERYESNLDKFIEKMRKIREQNIISGKIVNQTRTSDEYSEKEKIELKEYWRLFMEKQDERAFTNQITDKMIKEILDLDLVKTDSNDNQYINSLIDAIEESDLYDPDYKRNNAEEEKQFLIKKNKAAFAEDIDADSIFKTFNGQEDLFIEHERKKLKEERRKNKNQKVRSSLDYSKEEKKEMRNKLMKFYMGGKSIINLDIPDERIEDQIIRGIESPLEIKNYIGEKGSILKAFGNQELVKMKNKFVRDASIEKNSKKYKILIVWAEKKVKEIGIILQEKFVSKERKIRSKNIKKGVRKNINLTPNLFSEKEKLELKKRWESFQEKSLKENFRKEFKMKDFLKFYKDLNEPKNDNNHHNHEEL